MDMDKHKKMDDVYLDFFKAFDMRQHETLLEKFWHILQPPAMP